MKLNCLALHFLLAFVSLAPALAQQVEPPLLAEDVKAGKLPPMAERVPAEPRVVDIKAMGREAGQYGGTLRMLMGDQRDIRMATIYGYTRLMVFDDNRELKPDLLLAADIENDRIFTLRLRKGHRWSDGQPFTTEDLRYWWEDVANNPRLSPGGPPLALLANGQKPRFEVIDPQTVRFSWDAPNPAFLPALAAAQPLTIMMPGHYLKQFHEKYAPKADLEKQIKAGRVKDWGSLHERKARSYRPENPDLPTLDPWRNRTPAPAELFVFERNPYFHRVDETGRQLPFIDKMQMAMGTSSLIPAKVSGGDSDLQARYLRFDNYTFLKEGEKRQNYKVHLWERGEGAYIAILPNLNAADEAWRGLLRDVRFRRALSVGLNRRDINRVIFFGLGKESANTVLPVSPLYESTFENAWTQNDEALANRLLDELGLSKRAPDGIRLLPDGRRAEITIETAGENTEETDVMELVSFDWSRIGLKIFIRSTQRDVFRRRIIAGQVQLSVWQGLDNALPGADMEPDALAPFNSMQFHWPLFGQYVDTKGREGEAPSDPAILELIALHTQWRRSASHDERTQIWHRMLQIHADQVFTIGIVNRTSHPIVVANRLKNVPEKGIYSFEPGAFFGVYMPDTFWLADAPKGN